MESRVAGSRDSREREPRDQAGSSGRQATGVGAGGGGGGSATAEDMQRMSADEYLNQVSPYLKDVMTLLLENRPAQPVAFIQDYFKNVIRGSSPLLRSYRYIRFTEQGRSTFMDNLAASYGALETQKGKGGHSGISAQEYTRLVKSLCRDFPDEMLEGVLGILQVEEGEVVSFQEFAAGINTCLYYADFLDNAEDLYHKCAGSHGGPVKTEQYIALIRQLRVSNPELVMPSEEEVLAASGRDSTIGFEKFVSNIFAITALRPP